MSVVEVRPIETADAATVSEFLHRELNSKVSATAWGALFAPPWSHEGPNHGYQLVDDGNVVGAYVAVYSTRSLDSGVEPFCNLAAFCVREDYRVHSIRLVRALLGQKGFTFTDLSPSGNVIALNERLGFAKLDTATDLVLNAPTWPRRGTEVTEDPTRLEATLQGDDLRIYRDHRTAGAARHILTVRGGRVAYLMVRRDRRKGLPIFASILHAGGDMELLLEMWPSVRTHLLVRAGALATLADRRFGLDLPLARRLSQPRPRMFRSRRVQANEVDYLYSELTLVQW